MPRGLFATANRFESWPRVVREFQPRQLIVTLFGLYARTEHTWLSVASLIALLSDLGVESPAVRSSISRLEWRGTLIAQRNGGAAGYSLSGQALGMLAEETRKTLTRRGLSEYVDMFQTEHLGFGDVRQKVQAWWDLDELTELYARFLDRNRPVLEHVRSGSMTPRDAFAVYVAMLTGWRQLPYLDPGLPLQLLPPGWNGVAAGELFDELNTLLAAPRASTPSASSTGDAAGPTGLTCATSAVSTRRPIGCLR